MKKRKNLLIGLTTAVFVATAVFASDIEVKINNIGDAFTIDQSNGNEAMRITSDGRVGIGTNVPAQKLDVEEGNIEFSGGYGIDWKNDAFGGGGDDAYIKLVQDGVAEDTELQIGITNDANDNISFYQAGAERMTIEGGKIGIGTAAPAELLDVYGKVSAKESFELRRSTDNSKKIADITWKADDNGFLFNNNNGGYLAFSSNVNGEVMRVATNGNVGIGNTTPLQKLDVEAGNIGFSGSYGIDWKDNAFGGGGDDAYIKLVQDGVAEDTELQIGITNDPNDNIAFYQSGAERMTIEGGKIGIGTDAPEFSLDVAGSLRFRGFTQADATEWPKVVWSRDVAAGWDEGLIKMSAAGSAFGKGGFGIHFDDSKEFSFMTSGLTTVASFDAATKNAYFAGNIGINTIAPSEKLHVAGSVRIVDGTQGAGKVLTSDANGKASWQAAGGGGLSCAAGFWPVAGGRICMEDGNPRAATNMHTAIGVCKTVGLGSRVCKHSDLQQACAARTLTGVPTQDPFGGMINGWYGDKTQGDNIYSTINVNSCGNDTDGLTSAWNASRVYRCCY